MPATIAMNFTLDATLDEVVTLLANLSLKEHRTSSPKQPRTIDALPEELLDQIVFYLKPEDGSDMFASSYLSDLHSISITSRKFKRITQPYLYAVAPITLNKIKNYAKPGHGTKASFGPTMLGCNAPAFLRTLRTRPDLASQVKVLHLRRRDIGFEARWKKGFYGWSRERPSGATASSHTYAHGGLRPAAKTLAMDQVSMTLRGILHLLPNVTTLDCTQYQTDSPFDPLKETRNSGPMPFLAPQSLVNLSKIVISCLSKAMTEIELFLKLPNLQHLVLTHVKLQRVSPDFSYDSIRAPNMKVFELRNVTWEALNFSSLDAYIYAVLEACPSLEILQISYEPRHSGVQIFEACIPTLLTMFPECLNIAPEF